MKALNNRVILKVEKLIKKEKAFNPETQKMDIKETVELSDRGTVIYGNDLVKKGDVVVYQRYGAIQIENKKKFFIICVDSEDLYVKI